MYVFPKQCLKNICIAKTWFAKSTFNFFQWSGGENCTLLETESRLSCPEPCWCFMEKCNKLCLWIQKQKMITLQTIIVHFRYSKISTFSINCKKWKFRILWRVCLPLGTFFSTDFFPCGARPGAHLPFKSTGILELGLSHSMRKRKESTRLWWLVSTKSPIGRWM